VSDEFDQAFHAKFDADEFGPDEPRHGAKPRPNGVAPGLVFLSANDFVAGYKPQRPLIKHWDMKPGWLYSFTAPTGYAKTAISLDEAMQLARTGKRVVYLAGENPDEVRARVLLMQAKLKLTELPPTLRFVAGTFDLRSGMEHVHNEVQALGGADLIVVDTSPAFQVVAGSAEENSNTEQLCWALLLRQLTKLEGSPAVLALCHPVKRPQSVEDLLPRGGGSFLAEVDGNYASWLTAEDGDRKLFDFTWTGKFRGSFEPLAYVVEIATCERLVDPDGNPIKSVWAWRTDEQQIERAAAEQTEDDDAVLMVMADYPSRSLSDWARILDWRMPSGPAKYRVERAIKRLKKHKLTELSRDNRYRLTAAGKQEAKRVAEKVRSAAK
jgi:AAA domain